MKRFDKDIDKDDWGKYYKLPRDVDDKIRKFMTDMDDKRRDYMSQRLSSGSTYSGYSGASANKMDRSISSAVEKFEEDQISQDMETFLIAVRTNNKALLLMISKWESDTDESKNYFARMAKRELEREI